MGFFSRLKRLWRHRLFRQLVAVRIGTQAADGLLQVGTAAYVLFSPQAQPDAGSIAAVLAITLLPFSIIGPFVSTTLDRWNRRQVALVSNIIRAVLAAILVGLVLNPGLRDHWTMFIFYGSVLVAMSLNRYLMAGLSAALQHTVDDDEYLMASSVMPMIGPAGVVIGAGVAFGIRFSFGTIMPTHQADAIIFLVAAVGFAITAVLALRIPRGALGPMHITEESKNTRAIDVARGLANAVKHLQERRPAGQGLIIIALQRIFYGMTQVSTILLFRNFFHEVEEVDAATRDMGLWAGATAAGFILSAFIVPPLARRVGVRWAIVILVAGAGVLQIIPGSIFTLPTLVVAGLLLGIGSQSLKICVDTLVQAHVDDDYKGRVFTIYDMIFNGCFVGAALLTWALMPADGHSLVGFIAMGAMLILTALLFARMSAPLGGAIFDRGSEFEQARSTGRPAADPA